MIQTIFTILIICNLLDTLCINNLLIFICFVICISNKIVKNSVIICILSHVFLFILIINLFTTSFISLSFILFKFFSISKSIRDNSFASISQKSVSRKSFIFLFNTLANSNNLPIHILFVPSS